MIVADTSGLLALFNRREPDHAAVAAVVEGETEPLVVSPFVLAELDYLAATRLGVAAQCAILAELSGGAYHLVPFPAADLASAGRVIQRYADQEIGLADTSLVVLADRLATRSILTLDHRHFDVVRPLSGGRFNILPAAPGQR